MRILLITTLPNRVAQVLSPMADIIPCCPYELIGPRLKEYMQQHRLDILVTYRCPYIVPREIYTQPIMGAYNIHPSLLPKYKGLNPWEDIVRAKETMTGITIHCLTDNVDSGDIVAQKEFIIDPTMPLDLLRARADEEAAILIQYYLNQFF